MNNSRSIFTKIPSVVYTLVANAPTIMRAYRDVKSVLGSKAPSKSTVTNIYNNYHSKAGKKKSQPKAPYVKSETVKLKKRVSKMQKLVESDQGTHIDRVRTTARTLASAINAKQSSSFNLVTCSQIETMLANLKYYNPSVPGTLITASGVTGTYQKEFFIDQCHAKMLFRNNYQIPCRMTVLVCTPKVDTSIGPFSAFTSGLTDVGAPSATSPLVFATDSDQFNELWKIRTSKKVTLQAGQEFTMSYSGKPFSYDPSYFDTHGLEFIKKYQTASVFLQIEGCLGHDTALDEQGTLLAGCDYVYDVTYRVRYSAGADIKQIQVTNNADSFTTGAVVSNKPLADNQVYSVA